MTYYEAVNEIYNRCKRTGWVYDEVIAEFLKYCMNSPTDDFYKHMESAFHATAHK